MWIMGDESFGSGLPDEVCATLAPSEPVRQGTFYVLRATSGGQLGKPLVVARRQIPRARRTERIVRRGPLGQPDG